jgi:hypothetical protein
LGAEGVKKLQTGKDQCNVFSVKWSGTAKREIDLSILFFSATQ